jgi:cysteine-rich repeat protein
MGSLENKDGHSVYERPQLNQKINDHSRRDLAVCGDGNKHPAHENWDDGNTDDGDGCNFDCEVEDGWTWDTSVSPNEWTYDDWGNGAVTTPPEECDDGNPTDGDGCSSTWKIETDYEWIGAPSTWTLAWGNGARNGAEVWDDSNTANGDGW